MREHRQRDFTILIADRNRHVRELLQREFKAEAFHVLLAKSSQEVLEKLADHEPFDVLILDPDLPDADELPLLKELRALVPNVPLIIHTFVSGYGNNPDGADVAAFVEKRGDSIEILKKLVFDIAQNSNSGREGSLNENQRASPAPSCETE